MTVNEMNEKRKEKGYSYAQLSKLSGVPVGTIQKVLGGITKAPRYGTLIKLARALEPELYEREYNYERTEEAFSVEENTLYNFDRSGHYTIDDYYETPEGARVELIDGTFYNLGAPLTKHQYIIGELFVQFKDFIRKNGGGCVPFLSPVDVRLDSDDRTMLQPDMVIICDADKQIKKKYLDGAPDLVIEIFSPSTEKRDKGYKAEKYNKAGVREYWMIDDVKKRVIVTIFDEEIIPEDDTYISVYTFDDKVPVSIWGRACEIDFSGIKEFLGRYDV